ncbi:MAG: hypothetical protein AAF561_06290 [Planctomycetota bacterium]
MARALVIGAGPAGVVAAAVLARGGFEVHLAEAKAFPRDKVCGECLSSLGQQTLCDAGFGVTLNDLQPTMLTHATLVDRRGRSATLRLPHDVAGVTRKAMDAAFVDALPAEVVRHQPARVLKLDGTTAHLTTGTIEADVVFLADGKGTLAGGTTTPPKPTGDLGLKAHFTGVALDPASIALLALDGHYVGAAAVSDGDRVVWNLAMNVPAAKLRRGESHDALFERLLSENPVLAEAVSDATRIGDWLASPLPRFAPRRSKIWPPGVVPIGNAAAALEPIGGEGMGLAIASAYAAADLVAREGWDQATLRQLDVRYSKLWRTRRVACRLTAMAMSRGWSSRAVVSAARVLPAVSRLGLRLTGKADARSPAARPALS